MEIFRPRVSRATVASSSRPRFDQISSQGGHVASRRPRRTSLSPEKPPAKARTASSARRHLRAQTRTSRAETGRCDVDISVETGSRAAYAVDMFATPRRRGPTKPFPRAGARRLDDQLARREVQRPARVGRERRQDRIEEPAHDAPRHEVRRAVAPARPSPLEKVLDEARDPPVEGRRRRLDVRALVALGVAAPRVRGVVACERFVPPSRRNSGPRNLQGAAAF
mmetsp:Transcript_28228/g.84992  ORF Transcript_28228/g.84992 Transcript_28228/m.84992 type:complete len:224 (-) Transcript_28228:1117-1788(-)